MRQFVLPPSWDGGTSLEVSGKDARRLTLVLRLGPGDSFPALSADGRSCTCVVRETGRGRVMLSVLPPGGGSPPAPAYRPDVRAGSGGSTAAAVDGLDVPIPPIFLGVGLLKGSKLDEVVRAATEAGITALIPLETQRSVPKGEFGSRIERLRRLSREAMGQSGSAVHTVIEEPASLERFVKLYQPSARGGVGLYFHEAPLAESSIHRYCTPVTQAVVACVGPEGGFSGSETSYLENAGFHPAWLGPGVLRAETAAVFAIASIRIICLERTSWSMNTYNG